MKLENNRKENEKGDRKKTTWYKAMKLKRHNKKKEKKKHRKTWNKSIKQEKERKIERQ